MLHSLAEQVSYYKDLIENNPAWDFVGVYADEAVTGTKDNRPEFLRMLKDCRSGKIDMIITKKISRFARNTVTMLETVRELKERSIAVYFETDNINTLSGDGELMLSVLSSYAQEESHNVSENCKWRIRDGFQRGENYGQNFLYGYTIKRGQYEVDPEQAEIVRMIYSDYLSGMGLNAIRDKLTAMGVATLTGAPWRETTLRKMLRNEKYIGDNHLQKSYVKDHVGKKKVDNRGELESFYVEDDHPAIISHAVFLAVQEEFKRRADKFNAPAERSLAAPRPEESYAFTGKIVCAGCGANFRRRTMNASNKWREVFWQCGTYLRLGKSACLAKQIPEQALLNIAAQFTKRFKEGKPCICYGNFLGYRKGKDGQPEIVEAEAETVRLIYKMFLDGMPVTEIAAQLAAEGRKTARGNTNWQYTSIRSILSNE